MDDDSVNLNTVQQFYLEQADNVEVRRYLLHLASTHYTPDKATAVCAAEGVADLSALTDMATAFSPELTLQPIRLLPDDNGIEHSISGWGSCIEFHGSLAGSFPAGAHVAFLVAGITFWNGFMGCGTVLESTEVQDGESVTTTCLKLSIEAPEGRPLGLPTLQGPGAAMLSSSDRCYLAMI